MSVATVLAPSAPSLSGVGNGAVGFLVQPFKASSHDLTHSRKATL